MHNEPQRGRRRSSVAVRVGLALAVVCICVSAALAAQRPAPDLSWGALLTVVIGTGGIATAVTAVYTLKSQRRVQNAGADEAGANALAKSIGTIEQLLATVTEQAHQLETAREEIRHLTDVAAGAEAKAQQAIERCSHVEEIAAAALAANRMEDLNEFCDWFDQIPVPIAFASATDGGRIEWVNVAFCRLLGKKKEDFLGLNWTSLIVPADLEATRREQMAASRRKVWGFKNHWIASDTEVIELEWFVPSCKDGTTIALARPTASPYQVRHHQHAGK